VSRFAQYINDLRWSANVRRARAWRRRLSFSQQMKFDAALRHLLDHGVIAYPDAFYHVTIDDLLRATKASVE
jgi:hypothetical protein